MSTEEREIDFATHTGSATTAEDITALSIEADCLDKLTRKYASDRYLKDSFNTQKRVLKVATKLDKLGTSRKEVAEDFKVLSNYTELLLTVSQLEKMVFSPDCNILTKDLSEIQNS